MNIHAASLTSAPTEAVEAIKHFDLSYRQVVKNFATATGTLKFNGPDIIVKGDGGTVVYSPNERIQYEIKAFDTEGSQASGRGVKSSDEGKKKTGKVVAIDSGKKKKKK